MDNLKTLFDKKQYQLILSLTDKGEDKDALIFRFSSFIALKRYEEALEYLKKHKDAFYLLDSYKCIQSHIDLLLLLNKQAEAMKALKEYENMPYVSQHVEELLKELPNRIQRTFSDSQRKHQYSKKEIINILCNSKKEDVLFELMSYLRNKNITPFLDTILTFIKRKDVHDDIKTFALLLLVANHVEKEALIFKNSKEYRVVPSKLIPPFVGAKYLNVKKHIEKMSKDPIEIETALKLLGMYIMILYPLNPYLEEEKKMAICFIIIAKKYLMSSDNNDSIIKNFGLEQKEINNLIQKYLRIIENK